MLGDGFIVPLHEQFRREMTRLFWLGGCSCWGCSRPSDCRASFCRRRPKKWLCAGQFIAGRSDLSVPALYLKRREKPSLQKLLPQKLLPQKLLLLEPWVQSSSDQFW